MISSLKISLFTCLTQDEQATISGGQSRFSCGRGSANARGGRGGRGRFGVPGKPGKPGRTVVLKCQGNKFGKVDRAVINQISKVLSSLF